VSRWKEAAWGVALSFAFWTAVGLLTEPLPPLPPPADARVLRVIDGETIVVQTEDRSSERVRILGVSAPEICRPYTHTLPCQGALMARIELRALLWGQRVRLRAMRGYGREKDGRLPRLVSLLPEDANVALLLPD